VTLKFSAAQDGRVRISWGEALTHATLGAALRLFHGGNGSDRWSVVSPARVFFGVTMTATWSGTATTARATVGDRSLQSWSPNTGNLIGRGVRSPEAGVGAGTGLFWWSIPTTLRWFGYDGNGEPDITGAAGSCRLRNTIRSGSPT
jgi:hypothetical protein